MRDDLLWKKINTNPNIYRELSETEKEDEELALAAIRNFPNHIYSVPRHLLLNEDFLLKAVKKQPESIALAMRKLKSTEGENFRDLRDNREFMFKAIKINASCYMHIGRNLENDFELAIEGVKRSGKVLARVGVDLRLNKKILYAAYKQNPKSIIFAPLSVCDKDYDVLLYIFHGDENKAKEAALKIKEDREYATKCSIRNSAWKYPYPAYLRYDHDFLTMLYNTTHCMLDTFPAEFIELHPEYVDEYMDEIITGRRLHRMGKLVKALPLSMRDDDILMGRAVNYEWSALEYVSDRLKEDEDFIRLVSS